MGNQVVMSGLLIDTLVAEHLWYLLGATIFTKKLQQIANVAPYKGLRIIFLVNQK